MIDYEHNLGNNYDNMPKIFTIGFSGKSPDAFMDVLDAVRVNASAKLARPQKTTPTRPNSLKIKQGIKAYYAGNCLSFHTDLA